MGRHARPSWSQRMRSGWAERVRGWARWRSGADRRLAAGLFLAAAGVYGGMFLLSHRHTGRASPLPASLAASARTPASSVTSASLPAASTPVRPVVVSSPLPAAEPNPPAAPVAAAKAPASAAPPAPSTATPVATSPSPAPAASASSAVAGVPASGAVQPPPSLRAPVDGPVLAGFGWAYSPVFADWQEHTGVDLRASLGQAAVAPGAGIVATVRRDTLWGYVVSVALGAGYSTNVSALDAVAVHAGEAVRAGQELGTVGASPPAEAGLPPHVLWQLFSGTRPIDPLGA